MKEKLVLDTENLRDSGEVKKTRHLKVVCDQKRFFYRIANPGQIAAIGASFLEDFENGRKSFAISSASYKSSQQRTVLALTSYFDHLFDMKILIVSDSLYKGVFKEFVAAGETLWMNAEIIRFHHHFDFFDLQKAQDATVVLVLEKLIKDYDLVFWDTPILNSSKAAQKMFPLISPFFDSLSLIVSPSLSKSLNEKELKVHFDAFGINLNGLIFKELRSELA